MKKLAQRIVPNRRWLFVVVVSVVILLATLAITRPASHKSDHVKGATTINLSGRMYTLDKQGLLLSKQRFSAGDKRTVKLVEGIKKKADGALANQIVTVTAKQQTPPSGDKHDYLSLADYWWPNPDTPNGEPYVRKDGQLNPETKSVPDKTNFTQLLDDSHNLAAAYYFTGDSKYAQKAAQEINAWFVDPATRMNPNLNYAQLIKGLPSTGTGLIDFRNIPQILDDITLINDSHSLDASASKTIDDWFSQYMQWLINSSPGKLQADAPNNHGTWYDAQIIAIAGYLQDQPTASAYATKVLRLIDSQVKSDGTQPLELDRTRTWKYSTFNLEALLRAAIAAKSTGVDILGYENSDHAGIKTVVAMLVPYATGQKEWPHQQITQFKASDLADSLVESQYEYQDSFGASGKAVDALTPDGIVALAFPSK